MAEDRRRNRSRTDYRRAGELGTHSVRLVAVIAVLALLTGCGSGPRSNTTPAAQSSDRPATNAGTLGAVSSTPVTTTVSSPGRSGARPSSSTTVAGADGVPRFDHILVVVEENKPYGELVGTAATPFLTALANRGAVLTQSYAITHPSEPNYLALFSGSTQGLSSDSCPHLFGGADLAGSLIAAGQSFIGYAESLPMAGYSGCSSGTYARKHAPWTNFALPASVSQPMTAFPADFTRLPTVAFVVPDLADDMHDGSIAQGDRWLAAHLGGYLTWATTHNSLLVVTTDEDDDAHSNHITTMIAGAHVRTGQYRMRVDHYGVLHTMLDSYRIAPFAGAVAAAPITSIWIP